ncbi:unnamed protein product [Microthlaspi erraticum]|uniref:Uncharacterized protein n=1 Tax=Microthlaspi erraticum TaxID=1685480 RepID=A0A6D2IQ67_9BRAS|nr:unnamed protein product [Microthlaspi erraticum]
MISLHFTSTGSRSPRFYLTGSPPILPPPVEDFPQFYLHPFKSSRRFYLHRFKTSPYSTPPVQEFPPILPPPVEDFPPIFSTPPIVENPLIVPIFSTPPILGDIPPQTPVFTTPPEITNPWLPPEQPPSNVISHRQSSPSQRYLKIHFPVTPNPDMGSNQPLVQLPPPSWDSPPFNR